MKSILFTISFTFICSCIFSQVSEDRARYEESLWAMKKKAVVLKYMRLTEAEKSAFWPIYDSYSNATQYLEIEYMYLLSIYAKGFDQLSGVKIEDLSKRILKNDFQLARVRKQYFKKFKKALSPEQASNFMQLDHTFRTMIRIDMQKNTIPIELLEASLATKNF